jgi:hypothetical protein
MVKCVKGVTGYSMVWRGQGRVIWEGRWEGGVRTAWKSKEKGSNSIQEGVKRIAMLRKEEAMRGARGKEEVKRRVI